MIFRKPPKRPDTFTGPDGHTYGTPPAMQDRPDVCPGHGLVLSEAGICTYCRKYGGPHHSSRFDLNQDSGLVPHREVQLNDERARR